MPLGVQYSGMWTLAQQFQAVGAGTWKGIPEPYLYSWGRNTTSMLGLNDTVSRSSPVQVGELHTWSNAVGSRKHTMALKTDGSMWLWGANDYGQLGQNDTVSRSSPVQLGSLTTWSQISGGTKTMAIKTDGTMWLWGNNNYGQLGQNNTIAKSSPVQLGALTTWSKVASGLYHSLAIKTDGTLWSWGFYFGGCLGDNTSGFSKSSPVQIGAGTTWSNIFTREYFCVAIKTDGSIWSWGYNNQGQIGVSSAGQLNVSSPVQIGALTTWSQIVAGDVHAMAIKTDGTMWAWGNGAGYGLVGDNTQISKSSPVQVGALTTWSKIASGGIHAMALKTDGTMWLWGSNAYGQLGDGTRILKSSPIQIGTLSTWSLIAGGGYHSLAIANIAS